MPSSLTYRQWLGVWHKRDEIQQSVIAAWFGVISAAKPRGS